MKWLKKGLLFSPDKNIWWQQYYGILPTPVHLPEEQKIRIYFATTCKDKFGRITFIDVDENDPSIVLYKHNDFILDRGGPDTFDSSGVNVSSIIKIEDRWFMYYAGYQRHDNIHYSILSGLAFSDDGLNFKRHQNKPILERTKTEASIRSAPTVMVENGIFKMWYVADHGWKKMGGVHAGKNMPQYGIKHGVSKDGIHWETFPEQIFEPMDDEFGFGRPYITKTNEGYRLFYSRRRENTTYRIGFADSKDGQKWIRKDNEIGIDVSEEGWDSEMICYPAVITVKEKTFLFYNGNRNGETGFGYAILEK